MAARTKSEVMLARRSGGCCNRFADNMGCDCLSDAEEDYLSSEGGDRGYRGEPWTTDGRYVYDRDGVPFATLHPGGEEFGHTIVTAVNMMCKVPMRGSDPEMTERQRIALELLKAERERLPEDER